MSRRDLPAHLACSEYGDAGVLVEVLTEDRDVGWRQTQALGEGLRRSRPDGVVDVVAAFGSVFVSFDPLRTTAERVEAAVAALADDPLPARPERRFSVPVVYGGVFGPDLAATAELLGLTPGELVEAHSAEDWVVRFVGSPAGAPMMDGPRLPGAIPRLTSPRTKVARGSLGVSGLQSIIYNAASPGGWQLIGRTPAAMFDVHRDPPVSYAAGDRIHFSPVPADDWDRWVGCPPTLLAEAS